MRTLWRFLSGIIVVLMTLTLLPATGHAAAPPPSTVLPPRLFTETGRTASGEFLRYWQDHGGLAQQGYPISEEFTEVDALNGQPYTVQYFERAVFQWHPENAGTPFEVLLAQLGTFRYHARATGYFKILPP